MSLSEGDEKLSYPGWSVESNNWDLSLEALRFFAIDSIPAVRVWPGNAAQDTSTAESAADQIHAAISDSTKAPPSVTGEALTDGRLSESAAEIVRLAYEAYNGGDISAAAAHFSTACMLDPRNADAQYNLGAILHSMAKPLLAIPHLKQVILVSPSDATAHSVLGSVIGDLEPAAVIRAYSEIVSAQPENHRAVHCLATLTGKGKAAEGAAPEYVAEVFDELSEVFESKLVDHLGYRVPWHLIAATDAYVAEHSLEAPQGGSGGGGWTIVDMGCGSGLCGRLFRKYADFGSLAHRVLNNEKGSAPVDIPGSPRLPDGRVVGVDLSSKMIEVSRKNGSYDELFVEDAHYTLEREVVLCKFFVDVVLFDSAAGSFCFLFQHVPRATVPSTSCSLQIHSSMLETLKIAFLLLQLS